MLRVKWSNSVLRPKQLPHGNQSTSSVQHNNSGTTLNPTSGVLHQQLLYHAAPHLYIRLCVGICRGAEKCGCAALVSLGDARANAKRWTIDLEDSSTVRIDSHRDCNYGNCTSSFDISCLLRKPNREIHATDSLAHDACSWKVLSARPGRHSNNVLVCW